MKVMKAMRKLKFWSRKKRRKCFLSEPPPPPPPLRPAPTPPYYAVYSHYEPLLPSAPPLPPWLEYDHQMPSTSEVNSAPEISENSTNKAHFSPPPEICDPEVSNPIEFKSNNGCRNYTVCDNPVVPELKKIERDGGAFGCVVSFGAHLVRCVFPCFHIREVVA
ncbi:hypothetical protein CDL12_08606 [Handroanthus impetiginosus]|uniref:Uncharacterized protein n=1 Tax=Handroanthus impetiginosus TaxID=429701 RepID=A0A2G9HMI2_9LAMI|nr:hypothetical protein CDL12_08606 [Handroanthus impetiginosus]